jgi:hypothetical protein
MSTAITTTSQTLEEKLKERVRGFLLDVLPAETIDAYVQQSVREFIDGYTVPAKDHWSQPTQMPAKLPELIRAEVHTALTTLVQQAMREKLALAIPQSLAQEDVDKAVGQAIGALGPHLLSGVVSAMMGSLVQGVAQQVTWNLEAQLRNSGAIR